MEMEMEINFQFYCMDALFMMCNTQNYYFNNLIVMIYRDINLQSLVTS